jgi:hypothetical protein
MSRKDYKITPPPYETGEEPLFRVIYVIDVNAANALEAAKLTHQIMTDSDSIPPVLEILEHTGKVVKIDLSEK